MYYSKADLSRQKKKLRNLVKIGWWKLFRLKNKKKKKTGKSKQSLRDPWDTIE